MSKSIAQLEALFTPEELALIREQRAAWQRAFWAKMSPEERKRRKAIYELHTAQRKQSTAQEPSDDAAAE